jgi:hypothetical protein
MTAETDIWLNAMAAFPDVKPLVDLLRSDVPMPQGIRDLVAEMLAPGDPPIEAFRLECKRNPAFNKTLSKFDIETRYRANFAAGMDSDEAAKQTGDPNAGVRQVGVRQVHRIVKDRSAKRLHKRLKGQDDSH